MTELTPEQRVDYAYSTVRILLTMGRPPKAPRDWEPSLDRIVEAAGAHYRAVISESDAAAGLQRLYDESAAYVQELRAKSADETDPEGASEAKRYLAQLAAEDAASAQLTIGGV